MKIIYLGHAGFAIEEGDTLLIIDPWLGRNGAFDRAWFQFPRNHHLLDALLDMVRRARHVGLYVSHEHEDHFCRDTLAALRHHSPTAIIARYRAGGFAELMRSSGFGDIRELDDGEATDFHGLQVRVFIDESGVNRDSAILVTDRGGRNFLNFNDCKIFDRCILLHKLYAPIDVFTCQFTGATMHPICYEYEEAAYRSISRSKRHAKFRGVRTAIERLRPAVYMPSAGPAAFLDPALFHLNFESEGVFPKGWEFAAYLEQDRSPAEVVQLAPGGWLDLQSDIRRGGPRFDLDPQDLRAYLMRYQADVLASPASPAPPMDLATLRSALIGDLQRKLDVYAVFSDRLRMRSNVYFELAETSGYIKIDFSDCRVTSVDDIGEPAYYLHRTSLERLRDVLAGRMSWETYFLTFRFRNRRVPDEYDSGIVMFLFADPDSCRHGMEQLIRHREGRERITVTLADGTGAYEINRFCPHQGADLKYAVIDGGTLICPRHHWRFDLAKGGKCMANEDTIRAVRMVVDPAPPGR
jgi:UDP-MurNAc hydroxylase